MKKIWLTSLGSSKEEVQKAMAALKKVGLAVDGHFWQDDLDKMTWTAPRKEILDKNTNLWAIMASSADLQSPPIRYGLSMLALTVQAAKGLDFPIIILQNTGETILAETLPTPLAGYDIFDLNNPAYGAKVVAKVHKQLKGTMPPYRLDVYGIPQIGQWFEIGPREGTWAGALFGTSDAGPCLHTVGKSGQLPEKSVLNYQQRGLEIELLGRKFIAWAVQNELDAESSYYVKVDGHPDSILFSPFSSEEDAEVFVVKLK
jgi:hypothetical protein